MTLNDKKIPAYVISLPERTDRRKRMEVSLKNRNIEFEYWNALKLDNKVKEYQGRRFNPNDKLGSPGCYMSHITLLSYIQKQGLDGVLVMEDDIYNMAINAKEKIFTALEYAPKDCDMIYFEYILPDKKSLSRHNFMFHKIKGVLWGTACYYITAKGIELALKADDKYKLNRSVNKHLDIFYGERIHKLGNSYALYPKLCFQSESPTSIQNHSNFFNKYLDIRKTVNFKYL